ncbi:MAG: Z1 domain-containing protein [Micropepsaceae bacterium]
MSEEFDIGRFKKKEPPTNQYERQLHRLTNARKEVVCIEAAVREAVRNIAELDGRSFVIYGEPQSGKTEMMICLTAKLLDEGYDFILHLLNDSVDLLGQNLGRFKSSGLAPAARNFSEILDPAVKLKGSRHVVFCKKNGSDLRKLIEKIGDVKKIVVIDDEADFASPNAKINAGAQSPINELIAQLIGDTGIYIGVTATPARLDLNNTFDNDSNLWVNFPPHSKYTGQDVFFPLEGPVDYYRTLLPDSGSDPKYARQALFSFLVNATYLNLYVNTGEKNYSMLVHTSGKKADHKSDWNTMHDTLVALVTQDATNFEKYTRYIWELAKSRYPDADSDRITSHILENISRHAIIILNSERDWKDNSSAATNPTSLFTIIIGGNIVSRGVTLENLLSMFFTRDVQHKIQQDTYIQRARMFGSRGDYLRFFELTIPQSLYVDWHRCFVFHRLALSAIRDGHGSLVWLGDHRIQAVASSSIDRSTVDLDRGEMSFSVFDYSPEIEAIVESTTTTFDKMEQLANILGVGAFPDYLRRYISRTSPAGSNSIAFHPSTDISNYKDADGLDKENVMRKRGFMGKSQVDRFPNALHHLTVFHNGGKQARLFYKFIGTIQFVKNTSHDS